MKHDETHCYLLEVSPHDTQIDHISQLERQQSLLGGALHPNPHPSTG